MAKNKKILIIEDDKILADMYAVKFRRDGYEVLTTQNGLEGYNLAIAEKPGIILLDVILPEMDGFSILTDIKKDKNLKNTAVILLTNLGQRGDIDKGISLGATDYLTKSNITPAEVIERIKTIVEKNAK
ncbi:MAG: response regulator [bacterium]